MSRKYTIPKKYKAMLDIEFLTQFYDELHMIFGIALNQYAGDYLFHEEGTSGWSEAFCSACRKLGKDELIIYYAHLAWDKSDYFDDIVLDMMIENHLVMDGFEDEAIAKENELEVKDVFLCCKCGKYYHRKDFTPDEDGDMYECNDCRGIDSNVTELVHKKSISEIIEENLGLKPSEYFKCSTCNDYHFIRNMYSSNICKHCIEDAQSDNKNANNYYKNSISLNKIYKATFLDKDNS